MTKEAAVFHALIDDALQNGNKSSLNKLQTYIQTKDIHENEMKQLKCTFTKLLREKERSNSDVMIKTIQIFIRLYYNDIGEWLYTLIQQTIRRKSCATNEHHKTALNDLCDSIRNLYSTRHLLKFTFKFVMDNSKIGQSGVKIHLVEFIRSLLANCQADFYNNLPTEFIMAISRIVSWTADVQSNTVRKSSGKLVQKLYNLSPEKFSRMMTNLPSVFHERIRLVLQDYAVFDSIIKSSSTYSLCSRSDGDSKRGSLNNLRNMKQYNNSVYEKKHTKQLPHPGYMDKSSTLPSNVTQSHFSNNDDTSDSTMAPLTLRSYVQDEDTNPSDIIDINQPKRCLTKDIGKENKCQIRRKSKFIENSPQIQKDKSFKEGIIKRRSKCDGSSVERKKDDLITTEISIRRRSKFEDTPSQRQQNASYKEETVSETQNSETQTSESQFASPDDSKKKKKKKKKSEEHITQISSSKIKLTSEKNGSQNSTESIFVNTKSKGKKKKKEKIKQILEEPKMSDYSLQMEEILQTLTNPNSRIQDLSRSLLSFINCVHQINHVDWESYFKSSISALLAILEYNEGSIRKYGIVCIQELIKAQSQNFLQYIQKVIEKLIYFYSDNDKGVMEAVQSCMIVCTRCLNIDMLWRTINTFLVDECLKETRHQLTGLRFLRATIRMASPVIVTIMLVETLALLNMFINHEELVYRKWTIFCLVEIYKKITDRIWPHLTGFDSKKIKLLQLYIHRIK